MHRGALQELQEGRLLQLRQFAECLGRIASDMDRDFFVLQEGE